MITSEQLSSATTCVMAGLATRVSVLNCSFSSNEAGGVFWISESSLQVERSNFSHNDRKGLGGVIISDQSTVSLSRNIFIHNNAFYGGVISCSSSTLVLRLNVFHYNMAGAYGGVFYAASSNILISKCYFRYNIATAAGVLAVYEGTIQINQSLFGTNGANNTNSESGVISATLASLKINRTSFIRNRASDAGVISLDQSNFTSFHTSFKNNTSDYKGIFYSENSTLICYDIKFAYNTGKFSILYLVETPATFTVLSFSHNIGSLLAFRSVLSFLGRSIFYQNEPAENNDLFLQRARYQGGAVTGFQSTFNFYGQTYFQDNRGENGGAVYAVKSVINFYDNVSVYLNRASQKGGGIYLYQSDLQCHDACIIIQNNATNEGGGVYATGGSINLASLGLTRFDSKGREYYYRGTIRVYENAANYGGGLYLTTNAKIYFIEPTDGNAGRLILRGNEALYGGALYVDDNNDIGTCRSLSHVDYSPSTECFFQTLYTGRVQKRYTRSASFLFLNNMASFFGPTLYGGLLDRCSVSPFTKQFYGEHTYGLNYFMHITKEVDVDAISSLPVRLCFCVSGLPNCSYHLPTKYVKKGELFHISLVAVDQVNHTVNATVRASSSSSNAGLGEGQLSQSTLTECTTLSFNVYSPFDTETLLMYAEGPCKDAGLSKTSVPVSFLPCTCLIGFQQSVREATNCVCECHYELQKYDITCNATIQSIMKEGGYWISYINRSDDYSGFIYYSHCPYDYCLPPTPPVSINLNIPNGADAQCAFNKSGKLCGACQSGLSLSLGSSNVFYALPSGQ